MADQMTLFGEDKKPSNNRDSQKSQVLDHLLWRKSITPIEAVVCYRIMRLAPRILELRQDGHSIVTEMRRDSMGKKYAKYRIV